MYKIKSIVNFELFWHKSKIILLIAFSWSQVYTEGDVSSKFFISKHYLMGAALPCGILPAQF